MKMRGKMPTDSPDRLNVIVEGSKVIGDIITESNLRIDGEVLGNVTSASKVVIGVNGKIKGNLSCNDADIEGFVEGIIKVENLLSLRANASVTGEISTAKIQIDEGAKFSGNCKMSNMTKVASSEEPVMEKQKGVVY
jgi:cytoskeletal protein CcmA (bactofilin family)